MGTHPTAKEWKVVGLIDDDRMAEENGKMVFY